VKREQEHAITIQL